MIAVEELSTDERTQRRVLDELHWEHGISATEVGVEVHDGVVTLSGTVDGTRKRRTAEEAALRAAGVRAVVNDLTVQAAAGGLSDTALALAAARELAWHTGIPEGQVKARVTGGWVTLEGTVERHVQKWAAEDVVKRVPRVRGVSNLIEVDANARSTKSIP